MRKYVYLTILTTGALLVHGYHPGVEDAEIYIPGVKKLLNPHLYQFCAEFFLGHAHLTLFDELIAGSVRASHLPFNLAIFVWYAASIFLTLKACWQLSVECFERTEARWAAVTTVAALLTLPVAGTALYVADQYLTSRSIVTFAVLFAISSVLKGRGAAAVLWCALAACIHPLMALFGISYTVVLWRTRRDRPSPAPAYQLLAAPLFAIDLLSTPSNAYQQAAGTRPYFFLLQWQWYEWLGAVAPFLVLWAMGRLAEARSLQTIRRVSHSLIIYGLAYFLLALMISTPSFESAAHFQPMRSLHLLYLIMFLLAGGFVGQFVLKRHVWRWTALFLPLCGGMFVAQRQLFPASSHLELPGRAAVNDWVMAFDWIRDNTPIDALFAVDPEYMNKNDQHGFRAVAERSRLADAVKDSGAVTMFPHLDSADHWLEQLTSERGWANFREADFRRLQRTYGVSWILSERTLRLDFECPYRNQTVQVCRLD